MDKNSKNIISLKIQMTAIMLIVFIVVFSSGAYFAINYWNKNNMDYLSYSVLIALAFILVGIILLPIALVDLIHLRKNLEKLVRYPYRIEKIKLGVYYYHIKIFKDNTYFCTLRVRSLNPDNLTLIISICTPLSFFNTNSRRIVGDGSEIIEVRLPKAVWDVHTEFEKNKNSLIIQIDSENIKEKNEILSLAEYIKNKIEKMEYSDEHIRKIPDAQVAANQYMKGHICMKCKNLIPPSKIKDKCPVDSKPHKTKILLLDIHVPYNAYNSISWVIVGILILYVIIVPSILEKFMSEAMSFLISALGFIVFAFIFAGYFKNILAFKNMLKHFEAKKKFIMEQIKEKEET